MIIARIILLKIITLIVKEKFKTWEDFSVNSPSRDRYSDKKREGVTGNEYENGSKLLVHLIWL